MSNRTLNDTRAEQRGGKAVAQAAAERPWTHTCKRRYHKQEGSAPLLVADTVGALHGGATRPVKVRASS